MLTSTSIMRCSFFFMRNAKARVVKFNKESFLAAENSFLRFVLCLFWRKEKHLQVHAELREQSGIFYDSVKYKKHFAR